MYPFNIIHTYAGREKNEIKRKNKKYSPRKKEEKLKNYWMRFDFFFFFIFIHFKFIRSFRIQLFSSYFIEPIRSHVHRFIFRLMLFFILSFCFFFVSAAIVTQFCFRMRKIYNVMHTWNCFIKKRRRMIWCLVMLPMLPSNAHFPFNTIHLFKYYVC